MKNNQDQISEQGVPSFICFNPKIKRLSVCKDSIVEGVERRRSTGLSFSHSPSTKTSMIRRSTMPKVTQEDIDSLPSIHEIARLLMPPCRKGKDQKEKVEFFDI
jgi:hypothetical protein